MITAEVRRDGVRGKTRQGDGGRRVCCGAKKDLVAEPSIRWSVRGRERSQQQPVARICRLSWREKELRWQQLDSTSTLNHHQRSPLHDSFT